MAIFFWFLQEVILRSTDFLCGFFEAVNVPEVEVDIQDGLFLKYVNTPVQFYEPLSTRIIFFLSFCKFLAETCNFSSVHTVEIIMQKREKKDSSIKTAGV
jgi:hypothetical protein